MTRKAASIIFIIPCLIILLFHGKILAQAEPVANVVTTVPPAVAPDQEVASAAAETAGNITLDFKEADIQNVLKIISYKSGVNIVTSPDVIGNISIRLIDVPWEKALDVILKTYGYASEKQGNIILVTKSENMAKLQAEEPLRTQVFNLKYLDAQDVQKVILPLLSTRGKISILYAKGQKGWKFGSFKIGKEMVSSQELAKLEQSSIQAETVSIERNPAGGVISSKVDLPQGVKSKILVITDTAAALDRIGSFLDEIDQQPKQVLIEARIMEVNANKLKDIGFDWGTGPNGAVGFNTPPGNINLNSKNSKAIAGRNLASEFTPGLFNPIEGTTVFPGTYPYKAGAEIIFKKLTGDQFQLVIHALEEDAKTNTLSAPRIMTLDNQEAAMLVGLHTPILSATVTGGTTTEGPTQTQTLDYYQEIGIRLNVVPQVSLEEGFINMIVHPSITSSSSSITATSIAGTGANAVQSTISYPIIDVREAQTQILMKDGETIVIGGLLKDVKSKETIGIPYVSKIPLLGKLFQRQIDDIEKVDLLIFLTARVVKENDKLSPEEIARLEKSMGFVKEDVVLSKKKRKKK